MIAAGAVSTVALILADSCPCSWTRGWSRCARVRDNFWLVVHVLTITMSYAALALTMGIADITLGYYLFRSKNREAIAALSRLPTA